MGTNTHRSGGGGPWLVKIVTVGAIGKHSAVDFSVADIVILNLGLPPDEGDPDPPIGTSDDPPGLYAAHVATGFISQDEIYENEVPNPGLEVDMANLHVVLKDGQWTTP